MRRLVLVSLAALVLPLPAATSAQQPRTSAQFPPGVPLVRQGFYLYSQNCSMCHGDRGQGVIPPDTQQAPGPTEGAGPPLAGVGAGAADFYLRTGYMPMPLGDVGKQPKRSANFFDDQEIRALVAYVASLGPGLAIPEPQPEQGNVSEGMELFREHCAGCHQIAAEGGYVTGGVPPPLDQATPVQVAEAVRIGPYLMPRFSEDQISDSQLNSLIAYVEYTKSPDDAGGWGIGHVGPVPEGMVTWFLAATFLVGACVLIGQRLRR
jgi:quinol---cytochrome-c reductase cytochrome c subunit